MMESVPARGRHSFVALIQFLSQITLRGGTNSSLDHPNFLFSLPWLR
jgi:hypothetical protein